MHFLVLPEPLAAAWQVRAAFFDPGNDGLDVSDISIIAGVILVGFAMWWATLRALDRRIERIATRLDERTNLIQPKANSGSSLTDTNRKLDRLLDHLGIDLPDELRVTDDD